MSAVAIRNETPPSLQMAEGELITVMKNSLYPGASDASIKLVLGYCKARGLDPMKKPVHIVPMWDKGSKSMRDTIMPGIGSYRIDASRTGEFAGMTEPEFGPHENMYGTTFPVWCKVTVKRLVHGKECSFTALEFWVENYATAGKDTDAPNTMWKKRPFAQLAKCAEAQALRKAFPEETGGQPTAEEMEGKVDQETGEITRKPTVVTPVARVRQEPEPAPEGITDVTPKGEAPADPPVREANDSADRPASVGEIKFIEGKLKRMGLDIPAALGILGLDGDTLEGITLSQFNTLKALKAPA